MGPFIGDPGLRVGPGSIGLVVRSHGDQTADRIPLSVTASAYVPIPGLDALPVDMQVGYKYQIAADYVVAGYPGTTVVDCELAFALRDASTGTWGDWTRLAEYDAPWLHVLQGAVARDAQVIGLHDESQAVIVGEPKDAIRFAVRGDGGPDWQLQPANTYVRIEEYMP